VVSVDEVIQLLLEGRVRGVELGMRGDAVPATLGPADWMLRPPKGMTLARYGHELEVATLQGRVVRIQLSTNVGPKRRATRLARRTLRLVQHRLSTAGVQAMRSWHEDEEGWRLTLGPHRSVFADAVGLTATVSL
jgi:hypothetical protein